MVVSEKRKKTFPRRRWLFIDSATSGSAGGYIAEIAGAIDPDVSVDYAVSHYFPGEFGLKVFYKYSELAAQGRYRLGRLRLYVRALEMAATFWRLTWHILVNDIRVVCYALSSNIVLEYLFLWNIRYVLRRKVALICHDVIPFLKKGEDLDRESRNRAKFYRLAHWLIVHNLNSKQELAGLAVDLQRVFMFRFPLYMDFNAAGLDGARAEPSAGARFLFIGHLRPEKGVSLLNEAWDIFLRGDDHATLTIAGNVPPGFQYDFGDLAARRMTFIDHYIDDAEFSRMIASCDCVVLPYFRGTNSAVASAVLAAGKDVIVSNIPMFTNNELIPQDSFFKAGDAAGLAKRMLGYAALTSHKKALRRQENLARIFAYRQAFAKEINEVVRQLTALA